MASTNKTPKLGLNQWVGTDQFMREDFNGDNGKIDAAVAALTAKAGCEVGHYKGNGVDNRVFNLGFRPSLVILLGLTSTNHTLTFLTGSSMLSITDYASYEYRPGWMHITENGFQLVLAQMYNGLNQENTYIAFR